MFSFNNEVEALFSTEIFKKILNSDVLQTTQLNALISLLIKYKIPFDISYSPGTRREASAVELTVFINPTTTIQFIINFQAGGSIFTE